jgi:hypothetical protein
MLCWYLSDWLGVSLKENATQNYLSGLMHTEEICLMLQLGDVAQMVERSLSM